MSAADGSDLIDEGGFRRAVEASLKGVPFERALTTRTPEGDLLEPLYSARHRRALQQPGSSWRPAERVLVAQRYGAGDQDALRVDLARGVELAVLRAVAAEELEPLLRGVDRKTPLAFEAGDASALWEQASSLGFQEVSPLFDPCGAAWSSGELDRARAQLDVAVSLLEAQPRGRALGLNAAGVFEACGHAGLALGFALASLLELMRAGGRASVPPREVAAACGLWLSAGTDLFRGVALVRAARTLFARVVATADGRPPPDLWVLGSTTLRTQSRLDPATNMVRGAVEASALLMGGVDVIVVRPYDGALGKRTELGLRLAKNTPLVLSEESHLGRVADPASGSYYLEVATDQLARSGYAELSRIEAEGGLLASLERGALQARVAEADALRKREVANRKRTLVGTSDFVGEEWLEGDDPGAPRDARPFEALRERAARHRAGHPSARVLLLGLAGHAARAGFTRRLFEILGWPIELVLVPDPLGDDLGWLRDALTPSGAELVAIVGSDDSYQARAEALVRQTKAAGVRAIVLAGKPGALEEPLRAAGLTGSIHLGCDVVTTLGALLDHLEAP